MPVKQISLLTNESVPLHKGNTIISATFRSENDVNQNYNFSDFRFFSKGVNVCQRVYYLFHVAFIMFTGRWFSVSLTEHLSKSPEEVYDRLIQEWSSIAIISALLLTLSYNSFFVATQDFILSVITLFCCCCFILSILLTVLFSMALSTIPKVHSIQFTKELQLYITMPEFFMIGGLYTFCLQSVLFGYSNFDSLYLRIGLPIMVFFLLIGFYMWTTIIFILDRKDGLWEKIASS